MFFAQKMPNGNYSYDGLGFYLVSWIAEYFNAT